MPDQSVDDMKNLLPQRFPMVMVDSVVSCSGDTIITRLEIRDDNVFLSKGRLTAAGLIETVAQSAAARTGLLLRAGEGKADGPVPVGVIGHVRNFRVFEQPTLGDVLHTEVKATHEIGQASVVTGKVYTGEKLLAEGELKIFLTA